MANSQRDLQAAALNDRLQQRIGSVDDNTNTIARVLASYVYKWAGHSAQQNREDFRQAAREAAIDAIDRYDPSKGPLAPYLGRYIGGAMREASAFLDHRGAKSEGDIRWQGHIRETAEELRRVAPGYDPSDAEIAATVGAPVTEAMVGRVLRPPRAEPLHDEYHETAEAATADAVDADFVHRLTTAIFHDLRAVLTDVDRVIAIRRFGLDGEPQGTLAEVGRQLGMSRQSVQIREKSISDAVRDLFAAEAQSN